MVDLKQLRMNKMLSRRKVGSDLGVTGVTVYNWEKGTSTPNVGMILKIAEYYNVEPTEVFKAVART